MSNLNVVAFTSREARIEAEEQTSREELARLFEKYAEKVRDGEVVEALTVTVTVRDGEQFFDYFWHAKNRDSLYYLTNRLVRYIEQEVF